MAMVSFLNNPYLISVTFNNFCFNKSFSVRVVLIVKPIKFIAIFKFIAITKAKQNNMHNLILIPFRVYNLRLKNNRCNETTKAVVKVKNSRYESKIFYKMLLFNFSCFYFM